MCQWRAPPVSISANLHRLGGAVGMCTTMYVACVMHGPCACRMCASGKMRTALRRHACMLQCMSCADGKILDASAMLQCNGWQHVCDARQLTTASPGGVCGCTSSNSTPSNCAPGGRTMRCSTSSPCGPRRECHVQPLFSQHAFQDSLFCCAHPRESRVCHRVAGQAKCRGRNGGSSKRGSPRCHPKCAPICACRLL